MQRAIPAADRISSPAGEWRVIARPPKGVPINITNFRGLPIQLSAFTFEDPFGPQSFSFTVPGVTLFDRRGEGDLYWAIKHVDIDLYWDGELPANYSAGMHNADGTITPGFRWEGYITSFTPTSDGLTVQAKGACLQLDRWLAKPEYTARPLPYEWAIARQFIEKPSLRLHPLRMVWPDWWTKVYTPQTAVPSYMIPAGVTGGEKWTGLLTRSTGKWEPVLTNYIQTLLSSMYTERGRWTIDLDVNRQPVLFHRDFISSPQASTIVVDPVAPGVDIKVSEDWEQSLTDVYAQGSSLSGVTYSGMQVTGDGLTTYYEPAAALRQTHPTTVDNGWWDETVMVQEVVVQTQTGLSYDDAKVVAQAHLTRFSEPGSVGSVTLMSDPMLGSERVSRFLIKAGMNIHIPNLFGRPEGLIGHITGSSANIATGSVDLTIDTKFRDALTVEEVRTRGRDALQVSRMLIAGQYQPPIPDQMFPWSYEEGSGYIPSNSLYNARPLFDGMPQFTPFPWSDWTKQRPPKSGQWRNSYIRIGPADPSANNNWGVQQSAWGTGMGVPIRMGQAGQIRLLQLAAFDKDGNVLKVPFHVGFYYVGSVNVLTMPAIPAEQATLFPPYGAGMRYPFAKNAFEAYLPDGTRAGLNDPKAYESAGPVRIYGTYFEKAGYWPGSYAEGDQPTGLLVDESAWSWDLTGVGDALWDPYSAERNLTNPQAGNIYAMIYCDAQQDQEVFFLGRMFRVEPDQGG